MGIKRREPLIQDADLYGDKEELENSWRVHEMLADHLALLTEESKKACTPSELYDITRSIYLTVRAMDTNYITNRTGGYIYGGR